MTVKDDLFHFSQEGTVTIITDNLIIFQGQILKKPCRYHDAPEGPAFIVVKLICYPSLLKENGMIHTIQPDLFYDCDIISINIEKIIAVGPSRCCFECEEKPL